MYVCMYVVTTYLTTVHWSARHALQPAFSTPFNVMSVVTTIHADMQAIVYKRGWTVRLLRSPDQWRPHSSWQFVFSKSTEYPAPAAVSGQTRTVLLYIVEPDTGSHDTFSAHKRENGDPYFPTLGTRWVQWLVSGPSRFILGKKSSRYHRSATGCVLEVLWSW